MIFSRSIILTSHDPAQPVPFKLGFRPGRPLAMEFKGVDCPARVDGPGQGVRERAGARAALEHHAAGGQVEAGTDRRDVRRVQDLGAVGQGPRPKFGGGGEEVDPARTGGGGGPGAVGQADPVLSMKKG
jgi:hypothetical protein